MYTTVMKIQGGLKNLKLGKRQHNGHKFRVQYTATGAPMA